MVDLGDGVVELRVVLRSWRVFGIQIQTVSLGLGQFLLREAVGHDDLAEATTQRIAHLGQTPAHRRLADPQRLRHFLARFALEHPHGIDGKVREIALFLHHPDRGLDFGPENRGLVDLIRAQRRPRRGHPALVKLPGLLPAAPLERPAPIHLVAQDVLGNGEQPRREPSTLAGVVSIDGIRERRKCFLRQILHRFRPDSPLAPLGQLRPDHRSERLPQFKPRGLVVGPQPINKPCCERVQHERCPGPARAAIGVFYQRFHRKSRRNKGSAKSLQGAKSAPALSQ